MVSEEKCRDDAFTLCVLARAEFYHSLSHQGKGYFCLSSVFISRGRYRLLFKWKTKRGRLYHPEFTPWQGEGASILLSSSKGEE